MLYIIRGLPGSGKTTLGNVLAPSANFSTDDYFTDKDGNYKFIASELPNAIASCFEKVKHKLTFERCSPVAVSGVFVYKGHYKMYEDLCKELQIPYHVVICDNDFGNTHNVPNSVIESMADRFDSSLSR